MMADEQLQWLKALPFDEFVDSVDMDTDGEFYDGDGDAAISMALDSMDMSGMHDSVELIDDQDAPRRKRTMSTPLSPPKVTSLNYIPAGMIFPYRIHPFPRVTEVEAFQSDPGRVITSPSTVPLHQL